MLAVLTNTSLTTVEPSSLKRGPPSISPSCTLSSPTSSTWAPDNSALYLAHGDGIQKYSPTGHLLESILQPDQPVTAMVTKDQGNILIFSTGREVSALELHSKKISQIYTSHQHDITSLALSNDATFLAATSADAAHIHNLSLGTHSVLRGLPTGIGDITACSFHLHSRTRFLAGIGLQLVVYDTTRTSSPSKVILLNKDKVATGHIVGITCSPFSKSLIAVACSGGTICLIDLEKEKGLFRTLSLRVPLTSLVFSAEGAALFAGTEDGKILTVDLRALDKGPKVTSVSEDGQKVVCISTQRKLRVGETPRKSVTSPARALFPHDVNKAAHRRVTPSTPITTDKKTLSPSIVNKVRLVTPTSPPRTRTISTPPKIRNTTSSSNANPTSRVHVRTRTVSATSAASPHLKVSGAIIRPATVVGREPLSTPLVRKVSGQLHTKTSTPPKSPLGLFVRSKPNDPLDNPGSKDPNILAQPRIRKENISPKDIVRRRSSVVATSTSPKQAVRTRTISTTSQKSVPLRTAIGSHGASGSAGLRSAKTSTRPRSSSKVDSIKSNMTSPVPPSTSLPPTLRDDEQITSIQLTESRTPSPDLPNLDVPITPLPPSKKAKGKAKECMNVLGMETPREIANSDQGGNRKVGFVGDDDDGFETAKHPSAAGSGSGSDSGGNGSEDEDAEEAKIEMTVQISPRRPIPKSTWTAVPSPLRHSGTPFNSPQAGPSNSPAHDLLHSLIRDALYDFRKETKAEIIGLHLDLVRMGRGWKKEMKDAMEQWGTELKEVREENKRLKEENERLRRGY